MPPAAGGGPGGEPTAGARRLLLPPRRGAPRLPGPRRRHGGRPRPRRALRDQPSGLPPAPEPLLPGERRQALLPHLPRSPPPDRRDRAGGPFPRRLPGLPFRRRLPPASPEPGERSD